MPRIRILSKTQNELKVDFYDTVVALREKEVDEYRVGWIKEVKSFVIGPSGKEEAAGGAHDDDIMCGAMAWLTMPSATMYMRAKRRKRRPRDGWKRVGDHWRS